MRTLSQRMSAEKMLESGTLITPREGTFPGGNGDMGLGWGRRLNAPLRPFWGVSLTPTYGRRKVADLTVHARGFSHADDTTRGDRAHTVEATRGDRAHADDAMRGDRALADGAMRGDRARADAPPVTAGNGLG